jgi:hypothetical protein
MSAARRTKDKEMAATLKKRGVKRTSGNCPMCHHSVPNGKLADHFGGQGCQPRRRSVPRSR